MRITATGWNRDMGPNVIGDIDLGQVKPTEDHTARFDFDGAGFYITRWSLADIYWGKNLRLTGDYKVRTEFSRTDVLRLFRAMDGGLLTGDLVSNHGFVVYDDLKGKILKETKLVDFLRSKGVELSDVTLGDLIELKGKGKR
jgi:hypothetical protein